MVCDTPYWVLPKAGLEKVPVPCGRCPNCKQRRVNGWVFRMLQQAKVSEYAHFVTLTYDTRYVPITEHGYMTLRKKDFQDYMKRLRKLVTGVSLKYYAVGEYGSKNHRPHYHAIIFGVPDKQMFFDAWSLGDENFGGVHVGNVTSDSIAYTMKYIDKAGVTAWYPPRDDREKEFPLMSKGLGVNYLSDEMVRYHKADVSRLYVVNDGGFKVAMPRYFRDKIYNESEKKLQVKLIEKLTASRLSKQELEFQRIEYPDDYDFSQYQESEKYGRYKRFYSNNKSKRDL